jgi:hypothetical protein
MIEERLARVLGSEVNALRRVQSGGWTVSFHAVAELADGRTAFVKAGTEDVTSGFVRAEQRFYRSLQARPGSGRCSWRKRAQRCPGRQGRSTCRR